MLGSLCVELMLRSFMRVHYVPRLLCRDIFPVLRDLTLSVRSHLKVEARGLKFGQEETYRWVSWSQSVFVSAAVDSKKERSCSSWMTEAVKAEISWPERLKFLSFLFPLRLGSNISSWFGFLHLVSLLDASQQAEGPAASLCRSAVLLVWQKTAGTR